MREKGMVAFICVPQQDDGSFGAFFRMGWYFFSTLKPAYCASSSESVQNSSHDRSLTAVNRFGTN